MSNGEKHIEKLLSWYKEAVTEDGVCYLTCADKNTLAYALKCCKHFEDMKEDTDSWMLREELNSSEIPNKSEIPTSLDCVDRHSVDLLACRYLKEPTDNHVAFYEHFLDLPSVTPIRPKGDWIWVFDETPSTPNSPCEVNYAGWVCSCCHKFPDDICEWDDPGEPPTYKCCPNCGAKMESEKT